MSKGKIIFGVLILAIIALLVGVKMKKDKEAASKKAPMGRMGPSVLMASGFVVEYAKLDEKISANGNILALDEVQLQPEISGRVTYLNIKEGAIVPKGTLLVKINDADLQAQISKLKTQLKIAQNNFNRLAELLKIKGVSQSEYDAAENNLNNINADIAILKAQIDKTELRAPFSGKLGLRNISLGAMISPTTVVSTLQNVSQLKMDFFTPEKYAGVIHVGDRIKCNVAGIENALSARVIAIEPTIDEQTRNLKVRAIIENGSSKLVPGAYVKVELALKNSPNSILIPSSCIIPDDRFTKAVIVENGKAKFVNVEVGMRTESNVQILSGLNVGDTVLTTGLLQVRPDADVKITNITSNSVVK